MYPLYDVLHLIGQIVFGAYFIRAGINHFRQEKSLTAYASAMKVPQPKTAVLVSGVLLILGGLGIVFTVYFHLALFLVLLFLVPATFMIHPYWKHTDPQTRMSNEINFYKNIALIGAILFMFY